VEKVRPARQRVETERTGEKRKKAVKAKGEEENIPWEERNSLRPSMRGKGKKVRGQGKRLHLRGKGSKEEEGETSPAPVLKGVSKENISLTGPSTWERAVVVCPVKGGGERYKEKTPP